MISSRIISSIAKSLSIDDLITLLKNINNVLIAFIDIFLILFKKSLIRAKISIFLIIVSLKDNFIIVFDVLKNS